MLVRQFCVQVARRFWLQRNAVAIGAAGAIVHISGTNSRRNFPIPALEVSSCQHSLDVAPLNRTE